MQELLQNPAIQAAVAPFIVALAVALLLRRFGTMAFGLAIIGGLFTTVILTTGVTLQPLTSTRKIILSSLCLPFVVILMEVLLGRATGISKRLQTIIWITVPTALLVATANWVIWPILLRQEMSEAWPMVVRVNLYVGVIGAIFLSIARLRGTEKSVEQGASILVLGLGTAVTSMIAASALYAQLGFSIVAAVGALLLMGWFTKPAVGARQALGQLGLFGLFAAMVPLVLIGAAATVYAQLPGWALFWLATVPLFAGWPMVSPQRPWLRLIASSLLALLPVIPAIWLAWGAAAPMSY